MSQAFTIVYQLRRHLGDDGRLVFGDKSSMSSTSRLYLSGSALLEVLALDALVLADCLRFSSAKTSGGSLRLAACKS